MRILLDINIVLDVLFERQPWFEDSRAVWQAHDDGLIAGHLAASSMTDLFYIGRRLVGSDTAWAAIDACLATFQFCPVDDQTLRSARELPARDFEDNVLIACASHAGLDAIVTRDARDFRDAPIPVLTPAQLLARVRPQRS
jgi:predicted nucleic acid-binding protein